jgi:hypothetical protein
MSGEDSETAGTWEEMGLRMGGQSGGGGGFMSASVDPTTHPSPVLLGVWNDMTADNVCDSFQACGKCVLLSSLVQVAPFYLHVVSCVVYL